MPMIIKLYAGRRFRATELYQHQYMRETQCVGCPNDFNECSAYNTYKWRYDEKGRPVCSDRSTPHNEKRADQKTIDMFEGLKTT